MQVNSAFLFWITHSTLTYHWNEDNVVPKEALEAMETFLEDEGLLVEVEANKA